MVTFRQVINGTTRKMAHNDDLGMIDIDDNRLLLLHEDYMIQIPYNEIAEVVLWKHQIKVTLKNGQLYKLTDSRMLEARQSSNAQKWINLRRSARIIYNFLVSKWKPEDFEKLIVNK